MDRRSVARSIDRAGRVPRCSFLQISLFHYASEHRVVRQAVLFAGDQIKAFHNNNHPDHPRLQLGGCLINGRSKMISYTYAD